MTEVVALSYREFIGPVRDPESAVPSVKGERSFFIPLDQT
jgi:hypothetical protein